MFKKTHHISYLGQLAILPRKQQRGRILQSQWQENIPKAGDHRCALWLSYHSRALIPMLFNIDLPQPCHTHTVHSYNLISTSFWELSPATQVSLISPFCKPHIDDNTHFAFNYLDLLGFYISTFCLQPKSKVLEGQGLCLYSTSLETLTWSLHCVELVLSIEKVMVGELFYLEPLILQVCLASLS